MTAGSRRCIVVSTLAEACFYADRGFDDILYAYSVPFDKVLQFTHHHTHSLRCQTGYNSPLQQETPQFEIKTLVFPVAGLKLLIQGVAQLVAL